MTLHDPGWNLPLADGPKSTHKAPVTYTPVGDLSTLRQRLLDAAKRKQGDAWKTIRKAAMGERLLCLHDGPKDPSAPLCLGVDEYMSKSVIWTLATHPDFRDVPPEEMAQAFAPSLAILRADAAEAKRPDPGLWSAEHFAYKWRATTEKAKAKDAAEDAMLAVMEAAIETKNAPIEGDPNRSRPPLVQIGDRYCILDDRDPERMTYRITTGKALRSLAMQVWPKSESLCALYPPDNLKTLRNPDGKMMQPAAMVETYGKSAHVLAYEYAAEAPYLEDLSLVIPARGSLPKDLEVEGVEDPAVARWLHALDPSGRLLDWLAFAHPRHCTRSAPALAMIGASHIGKSLLAHALALAVGMPRATDLSRAFGQFQTPLTFGPILFADEGIPRHRTTQVPLTEEVRKLITDSHHLIEGKGSDQPIHLRGGVRVILAANSRDRLFPGTYSGHDVAALMRRLYVLHFEDGETIARIKTLQESLGTGEGDPARLRRIASHISYLQDTRKLDAPPAPQSAGLDRDLRRGTDLARRALEEIEAAIGGASTWIGVHEASSTLYIQPGTLSLRCEASPQALARALGAYTTKPSEQYRKNPLTGATDAARTRWIGLDWALLKQDGVQV